MLKIISSVKGLRKQMVDKKYQQELSKLNWNERLDIMLQEINRVNEELA